VRELLQGLPEPSLPDDAVLAYAQSLLATILRAEQERAGALPRDLSAQTRLANASGRMAEAHFLRSEWSEAERLLTRAVSIKRSAFEQSGSVDDAAGLSGQLIMLGDALVAQNKITEARTHYNEALQIDRALGTRDPRNTEWARSVAIDLQRVGAIRFLDQDFADATQTWREAETIFLELSSRTPEDNILRTDIVATRTLLSLAALNPTR
jgi:tetratricopeptide (TPR) repeat protein